MSTKMLPISTRLPADDVEFISQLTIEGAVTPSDKVRAIIADARRRAQGMEDFRTTFQMMQELVKPVREHIRNLELETNSHSELVMRMIEWLPDVAAYTVSANLSPEKGIGAQELKQFEQGLSDRVFRLMESVMQMGITKKSPCYDEQAIAKRIEPVLELAEVISRQAKRGEQ
ncbi:MAG: hypothetical protein OEZ47_09095 [Gammaproteobacteria bacterium]|nr:hypothetical protein [Gammaproteobacteria bacterium]